MSGLSPTVIWAILGMALLAVEIFTQSFVLAFFGAAALLVALVKATTGLESLVTETFMFAGTGFACILLFRSKLVKALGKKGDFAADKSQIIVLTADVPPHSMAKIEYQGTAWDAYNDTDRTLRSGDKVVVVNTEGIKLIIRPYSH